jgi:hypothetical protein
MDSTFPAVDALSGSKTRIHFNLGTIGRLQSYQVGPHGPWTLSNKSFHGALVHTNPDLPRPGRDLDAKVLRVPHGKPLALLAAVHHGITWYVLWEMQDQHVRAALQFACDIGRLEIGFIPEAGPPLWSAMHIEEPVLKALRAPLAVYKGRRGARDESWRDRLGFLLLGLPALLSEAHPEAAMCVVHSAMLLSGNPAYVSRAPR